MTGVLPIRFIMDAQPQGHGYTILKPDKENPYFRVGETIKGHEFHYSRPIITNSEALVTVLNVERGHGIAEGRDGVIRKNVFATYSHIHSMGNKTWAEKFFKKIAENMELVKYNTKIWIN